MIKGKILKTENITLRVIKVRRTADFPQKLESKDTGRIKGLKEK